MSDQIFDVILISKALQLDNQQNILADVYNQVKAVDGISASVTNGQYVEVTFAKQLDNTKDITIEAEATNPAQPAQVQAYEKTTGQLVGTFNNIGVHSRYRILLKNLKTKSDTFDLKVIGNIKLTEMILFKKQLCSVLKK